MSASTFVSIANELIFVAVFLVTVVRATRMRTAPSIDIAVLFGLLVATQQLENLFELLALEDTLIASKVSLITVPLLPYVLLRITDHFAPQRRWLMLSALVVTASVVALGMVSPAPLPNRVAIVIVAWFAIGYGYASSTFIREARRAPGVTAKRMAAAAIGSGLLAVAVLLALVGLLVSELSQWTGILAPLTVMGGAIAYYVGFATPDWLRRAWQEPSVRSFLAHSAELTREPDEATMIRRLERLAAEAMGVPTGAVGIASPDGRSLHWVGSDVEPSETPSDQWLAGRAFTEDRAVFSSNPSRDDPEHRETYRQFGIGAIMAAPMRAGDRRYGVLLLYAARTPLFAYSDLDLTAVLAQHAGGILESRHLLREAAEVQAREVAAHAKEDFLSAAAHDLRTPLSSMVLRAELLRRRLAQDGSPHLAAVDAVLADAGRVTEFVEDLLDAARAEHGRLSNVQEPVDLAQLAREAVADVAGGEHEIVVVASEAWVTGDPRRLRQAIDNLLNNAMKYSPGSGRIDVEVASADGAVCLAVRDRGIGVAQEDLPNLFERFTRGRNVDDRRFSGLGLGLYICRRIVEEHGGRIWAESQMGVATTMRFELPSLARPMGAPHG